MVLQFYGALALRGERLNLSFFFGLAWGVYAYKTIAVTLQKRTGIRHVWLLHWNGAIGWDKMELVPGLFCMGCVLGKGLGRRNEIGVENRDNAR